MVTFLVAFGFDLRYILRTDLISLDGLYLSAMRCTYLDKAEDAITMQCVVADAYATKGKSPLLARLQGWRKITDARRQSKGTAKPEDGRSGAAEFIADFNSGFRGLAGGG